jgi:hypothetical protein
LCHRQEIAQQAVQTSDLLQNEMHGGHPSVLVVDRERIFRLQSHRGDRVANFVCKSRCHPTDGRQTFGRAGTSAFVRKARAGRVERVDETIEFPLSGGLQSRQIRALRIVRRQRPFEPYE